MRRIAEVEQTQPATGSASWAYRDYVYGPGYVDEVVAQVAFDGGTSAPPAGGGSGGGGSGGGGSGGSWVTYYYLQDANYNVVAVLSSEPGGSPPAAPVVLASFTYDPYGNIVFAEYAPTLPAAAARSLRLGHQGLFYERFYADPAESLLTDPPLNPSAVGPLAPSSPVRGLYYNRNRWYSPDLGRFTSRDPKDTALPIIAALLYNADTASVFLSIFSPTGHYADGINLYAYVRSDPLVRVDPLGTFSYAEMGMTMGVQGLVGGLVSGAIAKATGDSFLSGFYRGFASGALGGAAGYAFAASASGLFATLACIGAVDGAVSGVTESLLTNGFNIRAVIADGLFGAMVGAATGGLVDLGGRGIRSFFRLTYLNPPAYVTNANGLVAWAAQLEKNLTKLTKEEADEFVQLARKFGVDVRLDPGGHAKTAWNMTHLNVGRNGQMHVIVPDDYVLP